MNIIKIAFNPEISEEFKNWIRENVNPSMHSERDKDPKQYYLEDIMEDVGGSEEEFQYVISIEDMAIIAEAQNEEVEYLEF